MVAQPATIRLRGPRLSVSKRWRRCSVASSKVATSELSNVKRPRAISRNVVMTIPLPRMDVPFDAWNDKRIYKWFTDLLKANAPQSNSDMLGGGSGGRGRSKGKGKGMHSSSSSTRWHFTMCVSIAVAIHLCSRLHFYLIPAHTCACALALSPGPLAIATIAHSLCPHCALVCALALLGILTSTFAFAFAFVHTFTLAPAFPRFHHLRACTVRTSLHGLYRRCSGSVTCSCS